jgi:hypothetical protein
MKKLNKKSGLYICKCYWFNNTTNRILPILKFGYTTNIDVRMKYYNKNGCNYKLLKFFNCDFAKEREAYIKEHFFSEHFRMTNSEHFKFESGLFKYMINSINEELENKYIRRKDSKFLYDLERIFDYEEM